MKTILMAAVAAALIAGPVRAETKQQHEIGCIAGTVTGALLGAALGGVFGNGAGRTLMQVAGGTGGAMAGKNLACK